MSSHQGRARRNSDCTAGGSRPVARAPHRRQRAEGADQAFVIGVLTNAADFARARAWGVTDAPDFERYLADTAELLADALERFDTVRARMFHPQDFAEFCLLHGLDPAEAAARDRYLVNPPLRTQLLPYQGEELAGDYLPRLVRARENGLTLCHADLLLDGALYGAAQGAEGEADEEHVRWVRSAYQRGGEVFRRMLVGAGAGVYELRLRVDAPGGRLTAAARVLQWEDGVVRINDEDLELVCAVLCAGLALELPGVAVLHGSQGSAATCGEYLPAAWAWSSGGPDWGPAARPVRLDGVAARPGYSLGTVC
ncbi:hypothetical protein [Streptomyces rubellomurinus]|uniref:Uncharacterized protein n=2 Tax=Streptomyces TaxID=1883 RepID=A0A0F2TKW4_STRR3|nr:hypothetical protein [Streptomyces rubellomurinus]KJS57155.1 hypothetical protein VM98_02640 [Streptomyces rubellomurinus subsp. indigoferus]KJS62920.1 hypothetical protein VM95_05325 [Streptomyces rubellomurinus]